MSFCTTCGAQLGFGRFCTNCGQPTPAHEATPDKDTDVTQVRLPRVQPDASTGARFPLYADTTGPRFALYADETDPAPSSPSSPSGTNPVGIPAVTAAPTPPAGGAPASTTAGASPAHPTPAPAGQPYPTAPASAQPTPQKRKKAPWPWIALAVVLLLGVGGGIWAVVGGDDDTRDASGVEKSSQPGNDGPKESTDPDDPVDTPSDSAPGGPDAPQGDPVDLAGETSVQAPAPRAPGQSADGKPVRYPANNMLDGDPETSYQISGNATGSVITFSFDSPVTLREVGMINGYAKQEGGNDWYVKNRKVLAVEWSFDDGSAVTQDLRRTTDMQVLTVDPTTTQTVTLTLLEVSKPGPDPRNNTAISEIRLLGTR